MRIFRVLVGLLLVLGGVAIFTGDLIETAIVMVVAGAVLVLFLSLQRVRFRRRLARHRPPGAVLGARLTADQLWTSGPDGTSQVRYGAYDSVRVLGDMVMLRRRGGISILYPIELFGPEGLARLRELIAAAQGPRS